MTEETGKPNSSLCSAPRTPLGVIERWAVMSPAEIRLRCGEMTSQEMRSVQAVLRCVWCEALRSQRHKDQLEWITVGEALPEEGTSVMVYCGDYCPRIAYYDQEEFSCGDEELEVTHWRPLFYPPASVAEIPRENGCLEQIRPIGDCYE